MDNSSLSALLQGAAGIGPAGYYSPRNINPSLSISQRLQTKKAYIESQITDLSAQLAKVNEAIAATEEHPIVTKLLDIFHSIGLGA